jgi:hypothetical protein
MTTRPNADPIKRLILEGLVVVASILVAFGLDAWWANQQLAKEVAEELDAIDRELMENVGLVEFQADMMRRKVAASRAIAELAAQSVSPSSITVPDTLLWLAVDPTPTLNASLGSIEAITASGRLQAIRIPELRVRLAGLRGVIEDAVEEQLGARDLQENRIQPRIAKTADLRPLHDIGDHFWSQERTPGRPVEGRGTIEIKGDLELSNTMLRRDTYYDIAVGEMEQLIVAFDEIRELIREELGQVGPTR